MSGLPNCGILAPDTIGFKSKHTGLNHNRYPDHYMYLLYSFPDPAQTRPDLLFLLCVWSPYRLHHQWQPRLSTAHPGGSGCARAPRSDPGLGCFWPSVPGLHPRHPNTAVHPAGTKKGHLELHFTELSAGNNLYKLCKIELWTDFNTASCHGFPLKQFSYCKKKKRLYSVIIPSLHSAFISICVTS